MSAQLPAPPVPADADLTDLKFMPLEVARIRRSKAWLICKRRPELAFYMLNLWTASWHERPAGSLEDDDDVLADAAMCSPEKWPKVREAALRGWVKCSDGRLYHPVVAEKVNDSWYARVIWRWEKECDRIRKENKQRASKNLQPLDFPSKPDRPSTGHPPEDAETAGEFRRMSGGIPAENAVKGEVRESKKKDSLPAEPGRAQPLPPDWAPTEALLERARKLRADIQPARLALETQGFISRKRSDNAHSHDWGESYIGWILKTKIEVHRSGSAQRSGTTNGVGSQARNRAAFGAALNRLRDQGSANGGEDDRRQDGDDAKPVDATVVESGCGPARDGERSD